MRARTLLVAAVIGIVVLAPAAAQQRHWLIGTWVGELSNFPAMGRGGPGRTLQVNAVAPNGAMGKGVLIINDNKINVALKIAGDMVSFITPGSSGADHKLTHRAGVLEGTWVLRTQGKSGPMRLVKK